MNPFEFIKKNVFSIFTKKPVLTEDEAEQLSFELIKKGELSKAVKTVFDFEKSQKYPRGVGANWDEVEAKKELAKVRQIFKSRPEILGDIDESRLEQLREAAAITELWGTSNGKKWLPTGFIPLPRLDTSAAIRMLIFSAISKSRLDDYAAYNFIKKVEIMAAPDSCEFCKKFHKKSYTLKKAIPLPHKGCTNEKYGCRCDYLPVIED